MKYKSGPVKQQNTLKNLDKKEDKQSLVYSRLSRHPARKRSGSNLSTRSPQGVTVQCTHEIWYRPRVA